MTDYETKDSGERESFSSGAVRDTQANKPRFDLIPPKGLKRVAELFARGASKYDDHNWRKGMPNSRFMASMLRHVEAYRAGDRDEDHIAAVVFNALAIIEFEDTEWDDLKDLWNASKPVPISKKNSSRCETCRSRDTDECLHWRF